VHVNGGSILQPMANSYNMILLQQLSLHPIPGSNAISFVQTSGSNAISFVQTFQEAQ
jgi:hypothetical protein